MKIESFEFEHGRVDFKQFGAERVKLEPAIPYTDLSFDNIVEVVLIAQMSNQHYCCVACLGIIPSLVCFLE